MSRRSPWRKILLWFLFLVYVCVDLSVGLPTATPVPSMLSGLRTDTPGLVTMYGFLDSAFHGEESPGRPALAHLSKVFVAMTQTGVASPPLATNALELAHDVSLVEPSPASTAEETIISTPPKQGPGLVLLTSQVFHPTSRPTATSSISRNASSTGSSINHKGPSGRIIILGSVVGGILVITLCLFLLLGLKKSGNLLDLHKSSKSTSRKGKEDKGISSESFASGSVLRKMRIQHSNETAKFDSDGANEKGGITESPSLLPPPSSKFSIGSTEYLSCSPRNSAVSSGSESSTVKATGVTALPPVRPPRPPTADSPLLSDSVYLACSDKPYVIVAPQPLAEADLNTFSEPQRILTPTEFLALHIPEILSSLPSLPSSKLSTEESSLESLGKVQHTRSRSSGHSRTKSEPVINIEGRNSKPIDGDEDEDDNCVRKSFVQRLIQHRRSRSASGWAYPDRFRSKKRKLDSQT